MSYQIGFDSAASAELSQLLHAVERQLNWHGVHLQTRVEAQAQEAMPAPTAAGGYTGQPCSRDQICPDNFRCGHEVVVIVTVAIVVIVAAAVGFLTARRIYKVKGPTN